MYADDTVLIAPSPNALQSLIYKCEVYASANGMIFNTLTSKLMCIKPHKLNTLKVPSIVLDNKPLELIDCIKCWCLDHP